MEKLLKKKRKAESDNNKTLLISVCIDLATVYLNNSQYQAAINEYKTVASIYKQQKHNLDYACANRMIGEAYAHLQMYDEALKYEEIYLQMAQKEGNHMEEQRAYATLGHSYLTMALSFEEPNVDHLNKASMNFLKSLQVCEKLNDISKSEKMDMMARLYANLGVVKEAQGNLKKGIELVQKSITICKTHDIFEQLERCYTTLCSLYCKCGDYSNALSNLNLGIEIASRLPAKLALTCSSLLAKADILMKMSDLQGAKRVLHKAYKLKTPVQSERETIEKNLKVVVAMNNAEELLLVASVDDHAKRKSLYEQLGDGACHFKNYSSAIEYYLSMLESAKKNNESGKTLSPCYVSLAQTYQDNKQYDKAIEFYTLDQELSKGTNLRDWINTTFNIIAAMDLAGHTEEEILDLYAKAKDECLKDESPISKNQLARVLERRILFLKKHMRLSEAVRLEPELEALNCPPSDSDSEVESSGALGDDVDINNITDVSSSDDEKDLTIKSTRKRGKAMAIKKNAKGETQLHVATINGNVQLATKLLEQGHVVNIRDHAGWLPIHEACIYGHLDIVKMLVEKGAVINDRGGVKCEGMTPLHDAASNGHLEVIEYMLSKGASPLAQTDNGETPLHMLKLWRSTVHLDEEEQFLYARIVEAMSEALEKAGRHASANVSRRSNDALIYVDDDLETLTQNTQIVKNPRRNSSSTNKKEYQHKQKNKSPPSSSDMRRNINAGDDFLQNSSAASDYRDTIELIRNSSSSDLKRRKPTGASTSALMAPDEVDFDDWLDDDLRLSSKKKRRTGETLPQPSNSIQSIEDISLDESVMITDENLEPNHRNTSTFSRNSSSSVFRKRKSQTTLLKNGFTRMRESPSPNTVHSPILSPVDPAMFSRTQTKMTSFVNADARDSSIKELDMNTTQNLIRNQMLFIDVRIDDKLFRIPFPAKDLECLTIHWLADETTNRFYKKEAMKPVIEMETKNGASLSDDDLLSVLFPLGSTKCEELRARVVKWNVPPLKERYLDACQHLSMEPCQEIINILDSTTINLNIPDRNYRQKLLPICRALNRQTNLYELNVCGNLVGNKLLELLCESLPSLTNLSVLDISTNHISCDGLSVFSTALKMTPMLQSLTALNLSFNPLTNESLKYLSDITNSLARLERLNLIDVDLTTGLFNSSYNQRITLQLKQLTHLDLSNNALDRKELCRFLDFVDFKILEELNLGANAITTEGFGGDLLKCMRKSDEYRIGLKRLNLSACALCDHDIFNIQRALINADQIEELNLSFNTFTGTALRRLLIETTPKRLFLYGCDELSKRCDAYDDNFDSWKFTSDQKCYQLNSTLDCARDAKQCDLLISMFRETHQDSLEIAGLDVGLLKLSVRQ